MFKNWIEKLRRRAPVPPPVPGPVDDYPTEVFDPPTEVIEIDPPGRHRLVEDFSAQHAATRDGGFTWRGHYIPFAEFLGKDFKEQVRRLHDLTPIERTWPEPEKAVL